MALNLFFPCSACSLAPLHSSLGPLRYPNVAKASRSLACRVSTTQVMEQLTTRRSGNYLPSIWDDDFVQSLRSDYKGYTYLERVEKLKEEMRRTLQEVGMLNQLELVDRIQRLGVGYHFDREIKEILTTISSSREFGGCAYTRLPSSRGHL
ncbi:alpha-terpineol synthase, chloroplastic-like [Magnolia sinica]|uniref:alpha-terpineol synthase, chloroplastic-like n=1 Tax=Magnolia sinica TaxID=86752 RepID=UPI00265A6925|nr:alpha-terpineol synthase, chloroplastic-like [Magnolia sinica]